MSLRQIVVQYIGDTLYIPKLEREVKRISERDYGGVGKSREFLPRTPEQTVNTLTAEQVREAAELHSHEYQSPFDPYVYLTKYDWQAIADELNATVGRGTCQVTMRWVEWEDADGTPRRYRTSHYDTTCGNELFWPGKLPPYCPFCKGQVVER